MKKTVKVSVSFTERAYQGLNALAYVQSKQPGQIISDGLANMKWMDEQRRQGARFFLEKHDGGGTYEIIPR